MYWRWMSAVLLVVCFDSTAFAAEPPALAKARALYNGANYEGAIDAASVARRQPPWADAAALVIARSHLERYRLSADPAALAEARETLQSIRGEALAPRDQVDLMIGLGQAMYLSETFGPAAQMFATALNRASLLGHRDRVMLLDWWATALDREAQSRASEQRAAVYARIAERMDAEVQQDAGSAVANYWLAVAARGMGDLEGAWDYAVAARARSTLNPETTDRLRADIDQLVTQALIPQLARTRPAREQQDALTMLTAEWELVRQQWK